MKLLFVIATITTLSHAAPFGTMIDLTHRVNENTINWPTVTPFTAKQIHKGFTDAGFWYESRDFSSSEHAGTHLDAPVHIREAEGGWSTADIPLERLVSDGVKIDVSQQASENPDYQIKAEDIQNWELRNGIIAPGTIVLFDTGRANLYQDRSAYLGYPDGMEVSDMDVDNLHFPGISQQAAQLLVARQVYGVGLDTPSLDHGQTKDDFPAHRALLSNSIWGLENVAHLDKLPEKGFRIINLPYNLDGGSGGPARVIAVLDANRPSMMERLIQYIF